MGTRCEPGENFVLSRTNSVGAFGKGAGAGLAGDHIFMFVEQRTLNLEFNLWPASESRGGLLAGRSVELSAT
jgi:hypothetical protein